MPTPQRQLDSRIEIVTPENIAFRYVLAGPFRRLPAYLIDLGIRVGVLLSMSVAVMFSGLVGDVGPSLGLGVLLIAWFGLSWFYGGMFEALWNGQTPGKRLLGLRVLSIDGRPINAMQAVLRNVLRDVDAWPIVGYGGAAGIPLYMLGLVTMAANDRYQRLGDLACGTIVVVEKRARLRGLAQIDRGEVLELARRLPVGFTASRAMAQALSTYVARRERFSPARRFELARILADPLLERFQLPLDSNPDLLLCALYVRTFLSDRPQDRDAAPSPPQMIEVANG
ncbi:MAG: RDD family protein [Pirellulales bacterium]